MARAITLLHIHIAKLAEITQTCPTCINGAAAQEKRTINKITYLTLFLYQCSLHIIDTDCIVVFTMMLLQSVPQAWIAGPQARLAGPQAWRDGPQAGLAGIKVWLAGP